MWSVRLQMQNKRIQEPLRGHWALVQIILISEQVALLLSDVLVREAGCELIPRIA